MLIVNGEKISPKDFCEQFGIDLSSAQKNTLFELAPKYKKKDKANGNRPKIPARIGLRCKFFGRSKHGDTVEVIYAETVSNRTIGGEISQEYTPRYIFLEAEKTSVKNDLDKALFMMTNPKQRFSIFRGANAKDYDYEHVDTKQRALNQLESLNNVGKAMEHVRNLSELDLIILAKGIQATYKKFNPFVNGEDTDMDTLRFQMLEYAHLNSSVFLDLVESKTAALKGRIVNMVDNKIIVLKSFSGGLVRQWEWAKGESQGQSIGDQIINGKADAKDYLVTYVLSHLQEYYEALHTVNDSISAEAKAMQYLSNIKEEENNIDIGSTEGLPDDFKAAQEWLGSKGYKKTPVVAKQLSEAVKDGSVGSHNIIGFVDNLFKIQAENY